MIENTDLFTNFKNVLPGDYLTEEINIKNNFSEFDFIKLYLRAVAHSEEENPLETEVKETETVDSANDFLSQLSLKVFNGDSLIFSASPDETDGLSENINIGTLKPGKIKTLRAELSVPLELGNEYANRAGEIDWIFSIEGFNEEKILTADTGFFTHENFSEFVAKYCPILGLTIMGILSFVLVFRKIKSKN